MAATIRKIAEIAGVSRGTVDRALHNKGRIDPEVANKIKKIAYDLNYKPNAAAKGLNNKKDTINISVILHISKLNYFFQDIMLGLEKGIEEVKDYGIIVKIHYCNDFDAHEQLEIINKCVADKTNGIIIVPINHDCIKSRINELTESGLPIVFLTNILDSTNYLSYVGCDYNLSGEIAAGLFNLLAPEGGHLLCFSPSLQMYGHLLRNNGLRTKLQNDYPGIDVVEIVELTGDDKEVYEKTIKALERNSEADLILCPGVSSKSNLKAISDRNSCNKAKIIAYDYSATIHKALEDKIITATITQQPELQGYTAVKTMFELFILEKRDIKRNNYIKTRILLREHLKECIQRKNTNP